MDIIEIADQIKQKVKQLEKGRDILHERAMKKAQATAEYERDLAIEIMKLKDAGDYPVTLIEKIARGNVWQKKLEMEEADALLKCAYVGMTSLETEISALQSLNRTIKYDA